MSENQQQRVSEVHNKYAKELLDKPYVVGVGIGLAKKDDEVTDNLAVVVVVSRKVPLDQLDPQERIPTELDGVRVDVVETGAFEAQ